MVQERVIDSGGDGFAAGIFANTYVHSLDSKKRLIIPSEWRELVGVPRRLFVMPGIKEKCLCVYPARELTQRLERLRSLSIADDKGRQLARTLASRSDWVPWDGQGRIRIKDELLAYAGLSQQVALVGSFLGFELWDPERWKRMQEGVKHEDVVAAVRYVKF